MVAQVVECQNFNQGVEG